MAILLRALLGFLRAFRAPAVGRHAAAPARSPRFPDCPHEGLGVLVSLGRPVPPPAPETVPEGPEPALVRPYYLAYEQRMTRHDAPDVDVLRRTLAGLHAMGAEEVAA